MSGKSRLSRWRWNEKHFFFVPMKKKTRAANAFGSNTKEIKLIQVMGDRGGGNVRGLLVTLVLSKIELWKMQKQQKRT